MMRNKRALLEILAFSHLLFEKQGRAGGHAFDEKAFKSKYDREVAASKVIFKDLLPKLNKEFAKLFEDYINTKAFPAKSTNEGKFAYALDKIEAVVQIIDWRAPKKNWQSDHFGKSMQYLFEWASYDPILKEFCTLLQDEGKKIIK